MTDEELTNKLNESLKSLVDKVGYFFSDEINKHIMQLRDDVNGFPSPQQTLYNWEFHVILSISATLMATYWKRISDNADLEKFVYTFVDILSNEFINLNKKPLENNYDEKK